MMASQSLANGAGAAKKGIASPWHMALVVVLGALNAYRSAIFAAQSRARLGPARTVMYLRIMFFELAFLTIVAAGVWLQETSLETIFGRRDLRGSYFPRLSAKAVCFALFTGSAPGGRVFFSGAFAAVHLYQGMTRALVIGASAILFGAVAEWRGTARLGMFAHALQDGIAPLLLRLMRP